MKCGSCTYWENDICYRKGQTCKFYDNICEHYIKQVIIRNGLEMNLKK